MSKVNVSLGIAAAVGLAVACAFFLHAKTHRDHDDDWATGYSADFVDQDLAHPEKSSTGTIHANLIGNPRGYYTKTVYADRERIVLWGTRSLVMDPIARTYWIPKRESRVAISLTRADQPGDPFFGDTPARRYVARETVNGRQAHHWEITEPQPNGETLVWQYWYDARLHAPLKYVKPGVGSYELRNIREGRQPAKWWDLPEGYREVPAPTD